MEQRRLRLGDIIDDYCPRERRLTNHAVVAIVGDEIKQTRCTTCDSDHVYKQARVPARRKKSEAATLARPATDVRVAADNGVPAPTVPAPAVPAAPASMSAAAPVQPRPAAVPPAAPANVPVSGNGSEPAPAHAPEPARPADDDWPVHRRLIRATLPRTLVEPAATRQAPDFTLRLPGARLGPLRDADFGFKSPAPQKNGKKNGRSGRKQRGRGSAERAAHARNGNVAGGHGQPGQHQAHGARGRRGRHHGKSR